MPSLNIRVDRITQMDAAHVLYVLGDDAGCQPGGFLTKLIEAMIVADTGNLERLALGYEGLVAALLTYKKLPDGTQILRDTANGKPFLAKQL